MKGILIFIVFIVVGCVAYYLQTLSPESPGAIEVIGDFIDEDRPSTTFETDTYSIEITLCEEGNVTCKDLVYVATDKESGEVTTIKKGTTLSTMCADGVTPCRFIGYEFNKNDLRYVVYPESKLTIENEQGEIITEETFLN